MPGGVLSGWPGTEALFWLDGARDCHCAPVGSLGHPGTHYFKCLPAALEFSRGTEPIGCMRSVKELLDWVIWQKISNKGHLHAGDAECPVAAQSLKLRLKKLWCQPRTHSGRSRGRQTYPAFSLDLFVSWIFFFKSHTLWGCVSPLNPFRKQCHRQTQSYVP